MWSLLGLAENRDKDVTMKEISSLVPIMRYSNNPMRHWYSEISSLVALPEFSVGLHPVDALYKACSLIEESLMERDRGNY